MNGLKRTLSAVATMVLTGTLGVVVLVGVAPPAGAYVACNYSAGIAGSVPIPDNGTATSMHTVGPVTTNDPIVDLDVVVNITHTFVSDLRVSLSYGGRTVQLVNQRGGSGDNFTSTRFNDGAATSIAVGAAPFTGHFRPEQSLNAFDGLSPGGTWTLTVTDAVTSDTGTLNSWSLLLRTEWCEDFDRDRVKDDHDLCVDVKGVQPHGCPLRSRSVTMSYSNAAQEFRGLLTCSAAARCADTQPVRIYKVRSGKDALVTQGFTSSTGRYALPKSGVNGRFYAVAPTVVEEGVAECKRASSDTRTI
jgi:subtilisin-like proprotein convertase family protein